MKISAVGYADKRILLKFNWKNGSKENCRFAVVQEK